MSQLITASELEHLDEYELRSKFCSISNDLAKTASATTERPMALASLENVGWPARWRLANAQQGRNSAEGKGAGPMGLAPLPATGAGLTVD